MATDTFDVQLPSTFEVEESADWIQGAMRGAALGSVAGPVGTAVGALAGGAFAASRNLPPPRPAPVQRYAAAPVYRPAPAADPLQELARLLPVLVRLVAAATGSAASPGASLAPTESADEDEGGEGFAAAGATDDGDEG